MLVTCLDPNFEVLRLIVAYFIIKSSWPLRSKSDRPSTLQKPHTGSLGPHSKWHRWQWIKNDRIEFIDERKFSITEAVLEPFRATQLKIVPQTGQKTGNLIFILGLHYLHCRQRNPNGPSGQQHKIWYWGLQEVFRLISIPSILFLSDYQHKY